MTTDWLFLNISCWVPLEWIQCGSDHQEYRPMGAVTHRGTWLTTWGLVTYIYMNKLTSIGSDIGLLPRQCQAIIWTNGGILLIGPLGTNFSEILIEIYTFQFKKMHLKMFHWNGGHRALSAQCMGGELRNGVNRFLTSYATDFLRVS